MPSSLTFTEGSLLRFDPFYFPDGGAPKSKFFVVLHSDHDQLLLATLPTSKDHIPSDVAVTSGCIELPERNFNAYVFLSGDPVTDTFSFPRNTFIYGANIHAYNPLTISRPVVEGKSTLHNIGNLRPDIFSDLIHCLKTSDSVRRKYKSLL